jgi:dihydrodipicolinate synthase/N-acetylneuraminate lyase
MTSKLQGVIAAVATAVDDQGEPDCARSTTLARFLLANGCDGLNVLGTTGEATSFSLEQRKRVMTAYRDSGLPLDRLMVGTGAASVADAVALTRHAAELGFAGALVLPPFYYKGVPDDGLVAYIETLVRATAERPIPIYLYHFPAQSGLPWHVKLVKRLLDVFGTRIVGLKDSSGDMAYARDAAAISPRWRFCRLHFRHRQSQCRPVRACLAKRRRRRARCRGRDPQAVRRQAAGSGRQSAARTHPPRWGLGPGTAAAEHVPGRRPGSSRDRI